MYINTFNSQNSLIREVFYPYFVKGKWDTERVSFPCSSTVTGGWSQAGWLWFVLIGTGPFCKGPDSNCCRLSVPYALCWNCFTGCFSMKAAIPNMNEQWMCSDKNRWWADWSVLPTPTLKHYVHCFFCSVLSAFPDSGTLFLHSLSLIPTSFSVLYYKWEFFREASLVVSWGCHNKVHELGGLGITEIFCLRGLGLKSKIKVSAWLVPLEGYREICTTSPVFWQLTDYLWCSLACVFIFTWYSPCVPV